MQEKTNDINEIIIRYLDGSADLKEKTQLLQWLRQSENHRHDFMATRDLWLSSQTALGDEIEVDIALSKLKSRILKEQERLHTQTPFKQQSARIFLRRASAAALLLLLLGMGYRIGQWKSSSTQTQIVQKQIITAQGSKGEFTLPDGTVVWLNSESILTYPSEFDKDLRLVTLNGGAYFEVTKDQKKPFIVQTGEIEIEVLGTSFNVSSYASNGYANTALLEGSVKISGEGLKEPIYLKPNELFEYQKATQVSSVQTTKASLYADWIKDRLVFDKSNLSDVLTSMEGRYNVEIEYPQRASATRVSLTIRQESLEEVLEALSLIVPIHYQLEGNKVEITYR